MERAGHVNIAMMEDISTARMGQSEVGAATDWNQQPCGSTVSFHNVHYKVQLKSGPICQRKMNPMQILMDLK